MPLLSAMKLRIGANPVTKAYLGTVQVWAAAAATDIDPPTVPTGLTANPVSATSIALSWSASTDEVGVNEYILRRGTTITAIQPALTFTDTGLAASTVYGYTVAARDAAGNTSAQSAVVTTTTLAAPVTPTGLAKTIEETVPTTTGTWQQGANEKYSAVAASTLTFTFTGDRFELFGVIDSHHGNLGVKIDTGAVVPADQYSAVRAEVVKFYTSPLLTVGTHTIMLSVLGTQNAASSGTTVTFDKAIAYVTDGTHDGGSGDVTAPTVPGGLAATVASSTQINLAWNASTDDVAVTAYLLRRGITVIATQATLTFADVNLTPSTLYSYSVAARDAAGNTSAYSSAVSATTSAAPTIAGQAKTLQETVPTQVGTWQFGTQELYSSTAGSSLTFSFVGDKFELFGVTDVHHGIMGVKIDSGAVVNVDQYSAVRAEVVKFYTSPTLPAATHTVVLTYTGAANPSSVGTVVTLDKAIAYVTDGTHDDPGGGGGGGGGGAFITRSGNKLRRDGVDWWFVGYNSFVWSGNCGTSSEMMSRAQVDDWLDNHVRHDGHGLLRIYQWPGWDRGDLQHMVAAARRNNVYLLITLQEWHTYCGQQGWSASRLNSSQGRADYNAHANSLLDEWKDEPQILGWEWFNEPSEPNELRAFFDALGPQFRQRDPNHLWCSGIVAPYWMGDNEGSTNNPNYRNVHESAYVDIASLHDYDDNEILSNHYDNCALNAAGKPVIVGEMGMGASISSPCKESLSKSSWSYATRAVRVKDKMNAYIRDPAGAGVCYWAWQPGHGSDCSMSTGTNDPDMIAAVKAVTK